MKTILHAVTPRNRLQAAAVAAILVGSPTAGVSCSAMPRSLTVAASSMAATNRPTRRRR